MLEVVCPHCSGTVIIDPKEINCAIFRHGVFKTSGKQIPPHASKEECDSWVKNNEIYGCGKPFKLVEGKAIICDYV
jgi:hypothetical protein